MIVAVKVPTPGESITEVEVSAWLVSDGDLVNQNQDLAEIESDKATLSITAPVSGKIKLMVGAGDIVKVNSVACYIDTSVAPPVNEVAVTMSSGGNIPTHGIAGTFKETGTKDTPGIKVTPLARKKMEAESLGMDEVLAGLRKLTVKDVDEILKLRSSTTSRLDKDITLVSREESREPMSQLRKKLSERLVKVKNETAMLTTFNEVDMSRLMEARAVYMDLFVKKHGYKLGLVSFFIKAVSNATKLYPALNSRVENGYVVTPGYTDVSVAVQSPRGLLVPVIRDVELLSVPGIEKELKNFADKAAIGKITIEEMTGGTITVSNGGTFGSMLSTPLINPPQSAILGMHKIADRPVAINGKVEIRPIMYVALSYDHRLVDGKDSVGFLMAVKKMIEEPLELLMPGL